MDNYDFNELLSHESEYYDDEYLRGAFKHIEYTFNPFPDLPNPLSFHIPTPPPPDPSSPTSPAPTDAGPPAVESPSSGDGSTDQPTGIDQPRSAQVPTEVTTPPWLVTPQSSTIPAPSSLSPPASTALFSPTDTHAAMSVSPPASKRRCPFVDEPDQSQEPIAGPSTRRRVKPPRDPYEGEAFFQLDAPQPPIEPSAPVEKAERKPPKEKAHSACRCPNGPTQKPPRHWNDCCPYNPNRGQTRVSCVHPKCKKTFSNKFNMERHVREKHWSRLV